MVLLVELNGTAEYSIFLYYLSNNLYKEKKEEAASYVYYLNKVMHSVDWFYAIDLPEYFGAEHPLGCILRRAKYGDYFFVYQGVTIGGNRHGGVLSYPTIGNNVTLYANTYIKDELIPDNCIVFGQSPNLTIKSKKKEDMLKFNHSWKL